VVPQVYCVCDLVRGLDYPAIQRGLAALASHHLFADIKLAPPTILGTLDTDEATDREDSVHSDLELHLALDSARRLKRLIPATSYGESAERTEFIVFDPEKVNFSFHLSVHPLMLDITSNLMGSSGRNMHGPLPAAQATPSPQSLTQGTPTSSVAPSTAETRSGAPNAPPTLVAVLNHVNAVQTVQVLVRYYLRSTRSRWQHFSWLNFLREPLHLPQLGPAATVDPSCSGTPTSPPQLASTPPSSLPPPPREPSPDPAPVPVSPFPFTRPLLCFVIFLRVISELLLRVLNFQYRRFMLKRSTAIGQQLDLRLRQISNTPWHYIMLRRKFWNDPCRRTALYINFYNHLWQIIGDVFIGLVVRHLILHHVSGAGSASSRLPDLAAARVLHTRLHYYAVTSLESMIEWLMGWPAGMKLNPQLDEFLGELFLWLIRLWTLLIHPAQPTTLSFVRLVARCGILGASFQVALLSDYISIVTLHIYWFYAVAARIYHWQLSTLHSLLNLFRGRRINPLRSRVDSCNFELDQLLLGTILLSLVLFLFPTIAVYYLTFAVSRVGIIVIQGALEMILAALNHFPFFAIVLRFFLPRRFPGGIRLSLSRPDTFWRDSTPLRYRLRRSLAAAAYVVRRGFGRTVPVASTPWHAEWSPLFRPRRFSGRGGTVNPDQGPDRVDREHGIYADGVVTETDSRTRRPRRFSLQSYFARAPRRKSPVGDTSGSLSRAPDTPCIRAASTLSLPTIVTPPRGTLVYPTERHLSRRDRRRASRGSTAGPRMVSLLDDGGQTTLAPTRRRSAVSDQIVTVYGPNDVTALIPRSFQQTPMTTTTTAPTLDRPRRLPTVTVYLKIENNPLPFSGVFFQYFQLWKQLGEHYFSVSIMKSFITGELIRPVPRLQYTMFPEAIPSLESMWRQMLNTSDRPT
ncbi:pig-Q, partial [Tieghemiomyces parasiticus]